MAKIKKKVKNKIKSPSKPLVNKAIKKSIEKTISDEIKSKIKIGVVVSRFNEEITTKLEQGAIDYLTEREDVSIELVRVPGAVEIPLTCQWLLNQGCAGVVALGAVIRGETSHYDYVCLSVTQGITELMLKTQKPISFGILTTENEEQALDRVGGRHGHKGAEAAQVVMEMVGLGLELNK
ncbi:MAG: 6,7-dimethyl-8-ribityllumazine synthase [Bdellovibrionaceae bacterium]|nr:6,7-dimethyl-8-ribityllumazine synthase [Pseudobdellovibrionaceae bacterium]NUM60036.1 6,7-dimethyl-8-ribityllumazine synthase [Pseudobdellovibrionaceae bacterium]